MAAADITRLINNARDRLPGAIEQAMQRELFNVMDEFFRGSNVWNEDIEMEIPGQDPTNTVYPLIPSTPALVDKLLWVYQLNPNDLMARGSPMGASMSVPGEMVLALQPSSNVPIRVTVALTVDDPVLRNGYVTFPAWVLAKYRDCILDGLLGKMMSQPGKPYTNTQLSVFHMRKFKQGYVAARVEWTRNNTYRQQAWVFPQGFSRGSQKGRSRWGGPA